MENIIKMTMDASQPEAQVGIDPNLFGKFIQQIPIWDYSSVSSEGYIALPNFEKEKLIHNYYSDLKKRGSSKFDIIFYYA